MLDKPPFCTGHAFERAYLRLGMERGPFMNWIDVTYQDWIGVNPRFLLNRNVGIILRSKAFYYVSPWTATHGVCMVVVESEFNGRLQSRIISVIDFAHIHEKQIEFRIEPNELAEGYKVGPTPFEKIILKLCQTGVLTTEMLSNILDLDRNLEGGDIKYFIDFAGDGITLPQLLRILNEPKQTREEFWVGIKKA